MSEFDDAVAPAMTPPRPVLATSGGIAVPTAPAIVTSPYDQAVDGLLTDRKQGAMGHVIGAQGVNPDAAGRAINLAPKVGVPAGVVDGDLAGFEAQSRLNVSGAIVNRNAGIANWLADDPMNARVANDDFEHLDVLSKTWRSFSDGWTQALQGNERGRLGNEAMLGKDVGQQVQQVDRELAQHPVLGGLYGGLQTIGGFAGGMTDNFMRGSKQAAQGMVVGAGAGAAVGAPAVGVGAIPGAIAGAATGAAVGFGVGWKWDMSRVAAGNTYLNLSQARGQNGEEINPVAKDAASVLVGLGTFALAGVGEKALGAAGADATGKLLSDAMTQAVTRPTVQRALVNFSTAMAKAGVKGAALNTAMAGTSIFGEELAKTVSGGDFATVLNDPVQRQQAVDQLITAATDGAMLFPLMHGVMAAPGLVADTFRAKQATADVAAFQGVETGAAASKTRERSLTAFQSFMQEQTRGQPTENLGVTGEAIRTLYQSHQLEPGPGDGLLGDVVPDLKQQLDQANETGGDIIVPTAAYVAHLAGTPISEALRADIRFRPDGMTAREAVEYEKARGEHLADLATQGQASMYAAATAAEPGRQVLEDIRTKLRSAGVAADASDQYAALVASRYEARAAAFEGKRGSALDLYQGEGLDVKRDVPESLRHVPTDEADLVINALRNGDRKVPSNKELFGPTLHEAVKKGGGVIDTGGELRAMDLHKTRGLIAKPSGDRTADIQRGVDNVARQMYDAGYFPELHERPTPDQFFEAMRRGDKRYSEGANNERKAAFEAAVGDLDEFVNRSGLDLKTATNEQIKEAIAKAGEEHGGRGFEQSAAVTDTPAFKAWFGDSKVLGPDGKPLVVYHGTPRGDFDQFDTYASNYGLMGQGGYFTEDPATASTYSEKGAAKMERRGEEVARTVYPAFLKVDRPLDMDAPADRSAWAKSFPEEFEMFEALPDGATNEQAYRNVEEGMKDADLPMWEGAEQMQGGIRAMGFDGITHIGGGRVGDGPNHRVWIAFDPEQIKSVNNRGTFDTTDPRILNQDARGRIDVADGKSIITLFKGHDLSTALHEFGHQFLEEMLRDAMHEAAPEGLKQDVATIKKWLGMSEDQGMPTTEQHEQFARGTEAYLMEGRAPSGALASAFRKFKAWLTRIYKTAAALKVPMSDEIRGVFDRMVASDDAIQSWRATEGLNPVFADAKSAGMTDAEFKAYTKGIAKARNKADETMLRKTMEAVRKQRTKEWKDEAASVREEVAPQVKARPDLKAQYFLRTGKLLDDPEAPAVERVRLSRKALDEMYGTDEASKALPSGIVAADGGAHPDEVAELFGYRSGDEMVKALMSLEASRKQAEEATGEQLNGQAYVRKLIDDQVRETMLERHGDALNDGSIEEEALAAVHNSAQADVMAMEMRAIARQAGAVPLRMEDIHAWADRQIADMPVDRGTDIRTFARAEAKAGREVERALLKGDHEAAFKAKQQQLINHVMGMKAAEAAEDYAAAQKLFTQYASKATMPSMEQTYLDRIHQILKLMGYSTKRSDAELAGSSVADGSLEKWSDQQADNLDYPYVPDFLKDGGWRKDSLSDLTTGEMRDLKDAITSISKIGRDLKTMEIDGKRIDLNDLIDEARETAKDMRSVPVSEALTSTNRTLIERIRGALMQKAADLVAQETVFNAMDGNKTTGVFTRTVFRPLKEALFSRDLRNAEMVRKLDDLRKTMPKGWSGHLLDKIDTPELIDQRTGKPWSLTRGEMIGIMLNMGNESNFSKMLKGEGWDAAGVRAVTDRFARKEDWNFVQAIWDMHDSLLPDIDALTRRDTGLGLDRVAASPVETPHGTFKGGYYPMEYDRTRAYDVEKRQQRAESLAGDNYHKAGTVSGHTKGRVERYAAPLDFSLDLIPFRLGQHIHDLYMREPVKQADRFLGNDKIRSLVEDKFGREYYKEFRPWLQTIAQDRNINDRAQSWLTKFLNGARANATVLGIGFRVTTMLRHGMTALTNSFGAVGPTHMLKAIQHVYGNPGQTHARVQFAMENSKELPHRFDSLDRDTREALERTVGNSIAGGVDKIAGGHIVKGAGAVVSGVRAGAIRYSHYGIATLDMASAIPTWYAGRDRFMLENPKASASDANYAGDKAVRDAHGAQSIVDLPAIQRGPAIQKLFTMFYGFMNRMYNRTYEGVRAGRSGIAAAKAGRGADARRDFAMMLNRLSYSVIIPAFADAIVAKGMGKEVADEAETWWDWAAKAIAGGAAAQIPILRDIANRELHPGTEYTMSPVQRAIETPLQSLDDLEAVFSDDREPSARWLQHAIETPGYVFGLPTGQAAGAAQYLWDLNNGTVEPEVASDVLKGVMFGPPPKGK